MQTPHHGQNSSVRQVATSHVGPTPEWFWFRGVGCQAWTVKGRLVGFRLGFGSFGETTFFMEPKPFRKMFGKTASSIFNEWM